MNDLHVCYGIIPLRKNHSDWEVFLVHSKHGFWGLPKGHPEKNETPFDSAKRELREETGLEVQQLLFPNPLEESYLLPNGQLKNVFYFMALVKGEPQIQKEEISEGAWFLVPEALQQVTFNSIKEILNKINAVIEIKN